MVRVREEEVKLSFYAAGKKARTSVGHLVECSQLKQGQRSHTDTICPRSTRSRNLGMDRVDPEHETQPNKGFTQCADLYPNCPREGI